MPRISPIAAASLSLAATLAPALARTRHHDHVAARTSASAPASHAAIPQNANIENLNDLSLRRARAGENTARPLAPPLGQ